MPAKVDDKNNDLRIIYIEPNDVYDAASNNEQKGEELTPKYEDMCISFNLIIEQYERIVGGQKTRGKQYSIEWRDSFKKRASVLQGNRGDFDVSVDDEKTNDPNHYNYLTTYYTDISFDSVSKKTEIEGLGVESVQISYESWYTPTVVIKFVDVRGSSLFGREEAIHRDEKLTVDNIFGAFFTMPYPLFRLQVKGFFGKPVTYQLACSGFKGEFNSQTGNFEAVATFIGYSWSLLTDIPFSFLVAAPYATYIGKEYWERKKNSREWQLWDDESSTVSPPTLYDVFRDIKNADKNLEETNSAATDAQSEELSSITSEKEMLNNISTSLNNVINGFQNVVDGNTILVNDETNKKEQLLLFSSGTDINVNDELIHYYENLYSEIEKYESSFRTSGITKDKLPNNWAALRAYGIKAKKIFTVDKNNITISVKKSLKDISFNDVRGCDKLTQLMVDKLTDAINKKSNVIKPYCYLIDFKDLRNLVNCRLKNLSDRENEITTLVNEMLEYRVKDILHFKPFIGNVFKIIFCHLETFCHIMFDSADEIYKQCEKNERLPKNLGITEENTDILPNATKNIVPWPAVYNRGVKTSECGYESEAISNIYAWVGNFSHNFIEEKVVYAIQEGIQKLVESTTDEGGADEPSKFFILPTEFASNKSSFASINLTSLSDMSGYLAMRCASIIGVLCGNNIDINLATLLGKIDAYNLYSINNDPTAIKGVFTDNVTAETIKGIAYCNSNYDTMATNSETEADPNKKYHSFETVKINKYAKNGRKPMFVRNNSTNTFVQWYDENDNKFVPTRLKDFRQYNRQDFKYTHNEDNIPYFIPQTYEDTSGIIRAYDWIYNCNVENKEYIKDSQKYVNKSMFNIVTNDNDVARIINRVETLSAGNNTVNGYEIKEDFTPFIDKFLKVGKKYNTKYYANVSHMLSGNANALSIQTISTKSEANFDANMFYYIGWDRTQNNKLINDVVINNDDDFELTTNKENGLTVSTDNLVIQEFKVYYNINNLGSSFTNEINAKECNIFGCPFYYGQYYKVKEGESENERDARKLRVKALLFLHTFKFNYLQPLNIFSANKKVGGLESVPKAYLLLLGGLLWRKRYAKKKKNANIDPIDWNNGGHGSFSWKPASVNETLFVKSNNGLYFSILEKNSNLRYFSLKNLFGVEQVTHNVENQLISLFEQFATTTFAGIKSRYELRNVLNKVPAEYDAETMLKDIGDLIKKIKPLKENKDKKEIAKAKETIPVWTRNNGFTGWAGKYSRINATSGTLGLKMLLDEEDTEFQDIFKDLYLGSYIIVDSCHIKMTESKSDITVNDNLYNAYLNGFLTSTKDMTSNEIVNVGGDVDMNVSLQTYKNQDLSISIYYYLKNLWDKWLVSSDTSYFDVANFFNNNFVFIDSFYKNTYHYLAINCQDFYDAWIGLADNGSLFSFISTVTKDHGCIFLPVPDFIAFNGKSMAEARKQDVETMNNLFRPMPFNAIPEVSNNNKFVVMYVHDTSHIPSNDNGYKVDTYDIWSHDLENEGYTDIAKSLFKSTNSDSFDEDSDIVTREGYNVPSFGVAFGRQNNHIFKNIRANMENPIMTEQAINALWNIAKMGSAGDRKVCFIGQDTFNVFTNYSYSVSVEMMGNAQICPLMYFQLLNVPMWRGTYMIYKVEHNMTPGNMITTFTGMKMSKYAKPFNTTFFIKRNEMYGSSSGNPYDDNCDYSEPENCKDFNENWASLVRKMGRWYENNNVGYGTQEKECSLLGNANIRPDCSGFVGACLAYLGISFKNGETPYYPSSADYLSESNNVYKTLVSNGFERLRYSKNSLRCYDIIVSSNHMEIYAGNKNEQDISYAWGSDHSKKDNGRVGGLPCPMYKKADYTVIWRKKKDNKS